ncbi:hypothetical protein SAMN02927916_0644 [Flavobacterium anhuiense]|uniref:Uncharacterized protein n=1 Tax=Flavobacterium anhuiense TaxID=459526 RepID=A0ABY0L8J4_9FLAO|nr:hypothetical protein SAMN02927916_0644 [Flavobacterium anhuiense]
MKSRFLNLIQEGLLAVEIINRIEHLKMNPKNQVMKNSKLTFEDFLLDTISKKEQKTIKGGDEEPLPEPYPGRSAGGGNN